MRVQYLRKKNMTTQKITVCAFIYSDGKMLWLQRAATKKFLPNKWELIWGHVENGETLEEALIREIQEEIQGKIHVGEIIDAFTYQKDGGIQVVEIIYLATLMNPDEISLNPNDHQKMKWLTFEETKELYDTQDAEFPAVIKGFSKL